MHHPTHLCWNYFPEPPGNWLHEFTAAVYYNGMPKSLHMHSGQRAYFRSDDIQAIWFSPNGDAYLFGLVVKVDDRLPKVNTIAGIVKQSVERDKEE